MAKSSSNIYLFNNTATFSLGYITMLHGVNIFRETVRLKHWNQPLVRDFQKYVDRYYPTSYQLHPSSNVDIGMDITHNNAYAASKFHIYFQVPFSTMPYKDVIRFHTGDIIYIAEDIND